MIPADLRALWREAVTLDRSKYHPHAANRCTLAIALIVAAGYVFNQPAYSLLAAGGALSVGFGVFQQFTSWRVAPMLLASLGMAFSTVAGSVAGQHELVYIACAALWGLMPGLGAILGTGGWWIATQWAIALLVAGSYPSSLEGAMWRGLLVLAGGLVQILITGYILPVREELDIGTLPFEDTLWHSFRHGLREHKNWAYALRGAIIAAASCAFYTMYRIPNGYWIAITAVILLKPEFRETLTRSVARSGGTLVGAVIATLLIALLRPGQESLIVLIVIFAWFSFAFVRVNYALFALCLTAYIVFLIGLTHLPPMQVVTHRLFATALGGALAMAAHAIPIPSLQRKTIG